MNKVAGAVIAMFTVGAGLTTMLSPVLGGPAEAASLALMGVGLFASSAMLSGNKEAAPATGMAKEA